MCYDCSSCDTLRAFGITELHELPKACPTVSSAASTAPWLVLSNLRQMAAAITASDAEHSQCGVPICT